MRTLFIIHETTRSGASISMLHLLRWLVSNTGIEPLVLSLRGGSLEDEFREVAPVRIWDSGTKERWLKALSARFEDHPMRSLRVVGRGSQWLRALKRKRDLSSSGEFANIYANAAVSAGAFRFLPREHPPIVTHVHELEYSLRVGIPEDSLSQLIEHSDRFIACAQMVKENLVRNHGVAPESIYVHYAFIPVKEVIQNATRFSRTEVLRELDLPANALIVGGSGSRSWHKGTDLFVQMAAIVRRLVPDLPVCFVWVGGRSKGREYQSLLYDLQCLGLESRVRFVDDNPQPHRYFNAFDMFALTSRVDSFPLVCLEAAALGKPIVALDAGGISEFIERDAGRVVPYGDITALAECVTELMADQSLRKQLGERGAEKVRSRHDVSVIAPGIARLIEGF